MLNPKLLVEAFPINKVEVFFDDLDHSNFLGFTWERISEGKFPVGYDQNDTDYNQVGKTGGEKEHTLTIDEMPKHRHDMNYGNVIGGDGSGYAYTSTLGFGPAAMRYSGNDQPHENRPPFIVMAFWKRIA
jgi:microcystin-dependent protein